MMLRGAGSRRRFEKSTTRWYRWYFQMASLSAASFEAVALKKKNYERLSNILLCHIENIKVAISSPQIRRIGCQKLFLYVERKTILNQVQNPFQYFWRYLGGYQIRLRNQEVECSLKTALNKNFIKKYLFIVSNSAL